MKTSIQDTAMKIVRCFGSKSLRDITVKKLIIETQINNDLEFYNGLDWLAKENKILLLITPDDTYVLPLIKINAN